MQRSSPILLVLFSVAAVAAHAQPVQVVKAGSSDSLYRAEGWKLFNQYLQHPHSEAGGDAGWQAFLMWANAGAAKDTDEALSELSDESELWSYILVYVRNAYHKSESRNDGDYNALLSDLTHRLTHPASISAVLWELAQYSLSEGDQEEAQDLFREIVALDARAFFVDNALGALYEMESLNVGQRAPIFVAEAVNGEEVALDSFLGSYVLIEFWSTWCGPCMPEIPHLKSLWSAYHDRGLQIVGVALEEEGTQEALMRFVSERQMKWPQILESSSMDGEIARLYNVIGIPNTYLIGPDGTILFKNLRDVELVNEVHHLMGTQLER